MPKIIVTDREGDDHIIKADTGLSLMEILREHGFDDIQALCGGSCSCATCHIYVDDAWLDKLDSMENSEDEMLETSGFREHNSRLSCQIEMDNTLDGIEITIAPED